MMKRLWSLLLCLTISLLLARNLAARPQVDASLDTAAMRIGDPLTLTLSVRSDPGETVRFPDLVQSIGKFEQISIGPPQRYEEGSGAVLERRSFRITTFETGRQEVPALPFVVMRADGKVDTLLTRALAVQVRSLLADTTASEVRPLKDLIGAPRLWHRLALWALLGLAVLAGLYYLWRRYLKRRDSRLREAGEPLAPPRPPYQAALEELERIKGLGLIEKGEIKLFHILVSDAIRKYLAAVFGVEALDMTTWELMYALEETVADKALKERIRDFLEACDLVKFAKYKPPLVEINAVFNLACDLVEKAGATAAAEAETAPVQAAAGPDGGSSAVTA
jgi:hypothetical protein